MRAPVAVEPDDAGSNSTGDGGGDAGSAVNELAYATTFAIYLEDVAIAPLMPTASGVSSYLISPPLPVGLALDATTGAISGTPSTAAILAEYTVTGLTASGALTAKLTLAVSSAALGGAGTATCARVNGGVQCWGNNASGQLGNNTTASTIAPVTVSGLTGVQAIAVGGDFACALVAGGAVSCWGDNFTGELGHGSGSNSLVPVAVTGLTSGVTSISAGIDQACAVVAGGGVMCWGGNENGQLGNGTTTASATPVAVNGLTDVQAVSAGDDYSCAFTHTGAAFCWGANARGQLGNNTIVESHAPVQVMGLASGVQGISAGASHTCAVVAPGAAMCWGDDFVGDLGNLTSNEESNVPVPVLNLGSGVQAVAASQQSTCALVAGGVQCWGDGRVGQLGNNAMGTSLIAVPVSGLTSGIAALGTGALTACAITSGAVECWGDNMFGELGNSSGTTSFDTPQTVTGLASGVQP